jgi:hypothetical protein
MKWRRENILKAASRKKAKAQAKWRKKAAQKKEQKRGMSAAIAQHQAATALAAAQ